MRILFSLVMAVLISCTIVSCGVKDVDAPTIDTSVETSATEIEGAVETTEPIEEHLHLGGMKSDVAPECKVMIKEKKNSEYAFIEDKDGKSIQLIKK